MAAPKSPAKEPYSGLEVVPVELEVTPDERTAHPHLHSTLEAHSTLHNEKYPLVPADGAASRPAEENHQSPPNNARPKRRRKWIIGLSIAAFLVILAAILGGVLGTRNKGSDSSDEYVPVLNPS
jgi:hypothetical protein